jgi:type I restriction enzyme M protein
MTDIENKTLEELKQYCRDNNIRGFSRKKKHELIDLIKEYHKNSSEEDNKIDKEIVDNIIINNSENIITSTISHIETMTDIQNIIKKNNFIVEHINQLLHNEGIEFTQRLDIVISLINYKYNGMEASCKLDNYLKNKIIEIFEKFTFDKSELIQKIFMFYGSKTLKIELDQFYTPITIGHFINSLCIPEKKIIDPACGTGDLLVNYDGDINLWDISPNVINICKFNYKLNNKKHKTECINSIKAYDKENGVYDYCCLNPPFGSSTVITEKDLLNKYELGRNKKKEEVGILFIERTMKLLKEDGIAFIILPNGYLGNSSTNTKQLRTYLLSYRIISIIELPNNTFSRSGTGVSTSMIIIQKRKMKVPYNIYIKKIINIGYILNKKNTPYKYKTFNGNYILIDGKPIIDNDLEDCFNEMLWFINNEKINKLLYSPCCDKKIDIDIVNTDDLDTNILDINRYLSRYTNIINNISNNYINIKNYIIPKITGKFNIIKNKEYIYLDIKQITSPIYNKNNIIYGYNLPGRAKIMLRMNDIIISKLKGKISFTIILDDVDNIVCTNGFVLLRPKDYKSTIIIFANLFSHEFKVQHNTLCTGSIMASISEKDIKNIYINKNINFSKYETIVNALKTITNEL